MPVSLGQPIADHALNQGLLHWYAGLPNISHGPSLVDIAGFTDGTLTNGPTWDYDPNGFGCLLFNGTNSYVTMGDVNDVEGVTELTVQAVINPNTLSGGTDGLRYIVSKEDGGGFVWILRQLTGGDKIQWYCFDGSVRGAQEVQGLVANTWNLVTATYKSGVGLAVYRNGFASQPIGFTGVGTLSTNSAPLAVGSLPSNTGRAFSGYIGDVRIVKRYTTPDEAFFLWNQYLVGFPLIFRQADGLLPGTRLLPVPASPPPPPPPPADSLEWLQPDYRYEFVDA